MSEYELPVHHHSEHKKCHSGISIYCSVVSQEIWAVGVGGKPCFCLEGLVAVVEHLCCQRPGEGHQNDEAGKSLFGSERRISVPRCFGPLFPWLLSSNPHLVPLSFFVCVSPSEL